MSLYSSNLNTLEPGEFTQPYKHATKLFVADTFRLAPKQSFLYYVVFEIDASQTELGSGFLNTALEFANRYQRLENGLLVKDIDLPKFGMGIKTLNAYNRKNIIQTNITYDPVNVTFHDDAANVITNFWNDYYTYYFRDSDYTSESYGYVDKYNRRRLSGWGYSPRNGSTARFLKSIRIFSLHNKNFTEYYLVNPVINSWRHGKHDASSNTGLLDNTMTVSYETVKYYTGFINPVSVDGFSLLHYDNEKSPIAGDFLGEISATGALNLISGAPKDLRKPDGSQGAGGPLSSLLTVFRTYQNLKNANLNDAVAGSIATVGASVLNDVLNGRVSFPTNTTNDSQVFTTSTPGFNPYPSSEFSTIVTDASGSAITPVRNAAINTSTQTITDAIARYARGIIPSRNPPTGENTRVYDTTTTDGIFINAASMQPTTGTYTAFITDSSGKTISEFTVSGTANKSYDPNDASLNLTYSQLTTDNSGRSVIQATYQDGTVVTFDEQTGDTLGIIPGSQIYSQLGYPSDVNNAPANTRNLISVGQTIPSSATQVITNTTNGIVKTVGGVATGTIVNLGSAAGTLLGGQLGGRTGAVVGGIIGRSLATEIATKSGNQIGQAISGGLTPIINKISGTITQGIDSITGSIKNVVGSWTGTGGFNSANPFDNLVGQSIDPYTGTLTSIYKDGTIVDTTTDGISSVIKGSDTLGTGSFWNSSFGKNIDTSGASVGAPFATIWTDGSGNPILDGAGQYLVSDGDTTFIPTAFTEETWNQLSDIDQSMLDDSIFSDWGSTYPGTDNFLDDFDLSTTDWPW